MFEKISVSKFDKIIFFVKKLRVSKEKNFFGKKLQVS